MPSSYFQCKTEAGRSLSDSFLLSWLFLLLPKHFSVLQCSFHCFTPPPPPPALQFAVSRNREWYEAVYCVCPDKLKASPLLYTSSVLMILCTWTFSQKPALHVVVLMRLSSCHCLCKLTVLHGARLGGGGGGCTNSRFITAELQNPQTWERVFVGSVCMRFQYSYSAGRVHTECRPRAQQELGARSARGGPWLVPAATWRGSCHGHMRRTSSSGRPPDPSPSSRSPLLLHSLLSLDPSVCLSTFLLFLRSTLSFRQWNQRWQTKARPQVPFS